MNTLPTRVSLLILVPLLVVLASCGAVTSTQPGKSNAATLKDLAFVKQQIAHYEQVPRFISPGPPFDVAKVRGKSIAVIPATSNQYDTTIETEMKALAEKYGVSYTEYPNQGEPTQWVSELNTAIASKPQLIILNTALNPELVLPEVERAHSLGIPVLATHFFDQSYSQSLHTSCGGPASLCSDGLTASVNAPFDLATRLEADWIIANSGADATVLVITANDTAPAPGMVTAARAQFHKYCPRCHVIVRNVDASSWPSDIPGLVSGQLAANPTMKYVMPLYDFGAPYAADGISLAGKTGKVDVVSYNGTQSVLQMLENHDAVTADVGEPLYWLAYAFMDQAFRLLAGVPPVANEHTPVRLWVASNIKDAGVPPSVTGGYGNAYVAGYTALWRR